jgi:hypothetical protein
MPRISWRRAELADSHDDAKPGVGAVLITSATHRLNYLAGFGHRLILGVARVLG